MYSTVHYLILDLITSNMYVLFKRLDSTRRSGAANANINFGPLTLARMIDNSMTLIITSK